MKISEPPRTAIEQLLLSHASDEAMRDIDLSWLRGKKVFVDDKYFDSVDKAYAISLIREHASLDGALLQKTDATADVVLEIRSGGLGMGQNESLFGIPAMTIPVPLSGSFQTPEIAFYKSQKADSVAKFAMFAYVRETGQNYGAKGPVSGFGRFYIYKLLGFSWRRTDVPQLRKHPRHEDESLRWPNDYSGPPEIPPSPPPSATPPAKPAAEEKAPPEAKPAAGTNAPVAP